MCLLPSLFLSVALLLIGCSDSNDPVTGPLSGSFTTAFDLVPLQFTEEGEIALAMMAPQARPKFTRSVRRAVRSSWSHRFGMGDAARRWAHPVIVENRCLCVTLIPNARRLRLHPRGRYSTFFFSLIRSVMRTVAFTVMLGMLLGLGACAEPPNERVGDVLVLGDTTDTVRLEGTVWFYDYDEGFWAIDGGAQIYEPLELPEAFRQDGTPVAAHVIVREDLASRDLTGPPVELRRIERQ